MKHFAKILFLLALLIPCVAFAADPVKLYSHQTGRWNGFNTWTTDPSGINFVNQSHLVPDENTIVEIIPGITVTVDDSKVIDINAITVNGILKLNNSQGHNVANYIKGNGRIVMIADNYPNTAANDFIIDGGTTVFEGADNIVLNTPREYSNLEINSATVFFGADITCRGSLSVVNNGKLCFKSQQKSNLVINDGLVVNSGCKIWVDERSLPFKIHINGDLKNSGDVKFSSLDSYQSSPLSAGYADVYFESDRQDQIVYCNNAIHFYR